MEVNVKKQIFLCGRCLIHTRSLWSHQRIHQRRRRSHQSSQDALLNLVCSVSSEKEITTLQEPMDCHCAFKSHSCAPAMTLYLHWKLFNLVIYSTAPLISDGSFRVTMCRTELLGFLPGFSLAIVSSSAECKGSLGVAEVLGIFVSSVFS